MEKWRKGGLMYIGFLAVATVGIYVCLKLELSYLKNLIILSAALVGPYIGETYFSYKNKKTPKKKWALYAVIILLLTGLITWLMENH